MLNIDPDDKVKAFIKVKKLNDEEYLNSHYIVMGTREGIVKKSSLKDYSRPRVNGVNAITIKDGDELLQARLTDGNAEVLMATCNGRAIRFNEKHVRSMGRTAAGVKGITLSSADDAVIGMICVSDPNDDILVVSEKGYGKRSKLEDYRVTNRGGKGVKTMKITDKTGKLIAIKNVTDEHDLMIINKSGIAIRLAVKEISTLGRATQGVKLINLSKKQDAIASVTKVPSSNGEEENAENTQNIEGKEQQPDDNDNSSTETNE
jgi:DNA gyrase subunit A